MKNTTSTIALLSVLALAATPVLAQNTSQGQSDQSTPGASPGGDTGTQSPTKPHHKKKKHHRKQSGSSSQSDTQHPGNENQSGMPTTQPGGQGTQSGQNPAGPPSDSSSNQGGGGTSR